MMHHMVHAMRILVSHVNNYHFSTWIKTTEILIDLIVASVFFSLK